MCKCNKPDFDSNSTDKLWNSFPEHDQQVGVYRKMGHPYDYSIGRVVDVILVDFGTDNPFYDYIVEFQYLKGDDGEVLRERFGQWEIYPIYCY